MADLGAVTRELIREALDAIGDQMSLSIVRTSHSDTVKNAMDFSTAICDAQGQMIGQGLTLPNQLGSIPDAMAACLRHFTGDLEPGDILVLNDPFDGGMHLPDIFVFKPVFHEGALIAFIATVAHHADVGGAVPGSLAPDCEECYQEGLRIPPLKLYRRGQPDRAIEALIRANVRLPEIVMGDFAAQVAACHTGEAGLLRLVEANGLQPFQEHVRQILDYTERLTRVEIRGLPDGTYRKTDYIDDDGLRPDPIPISVAITVRGDTIEADFEGSSPQIPAALNGTLSFTKSCVYCALRTVMRADIPRNAGFFRPITVKAPPGTIVNCVLPAATANRGLTGFRIIDAVFGALAKVLPDRVMGASDGGLTLVGISGRREGSGRPYSLLELLSGSWGGRPDRDGLEGMPNLGANVSNIPVEQIEVGYPIRIDQYGFLPDSGGAGQYRGGVSIVRDFRVLQDSVLTVRADRQKIMPYGVNGGRDGTPSANILNPDGEAQVLPSKFSRRILRGDVFRHITAGAGGWGEPLRRDPRSVARDVRNGLLSRGRALDDYGVVLTPELRLDEVATAEERAPRTGG